jgi:hypothetical protein
VDDFEAISGTLVAAKKREVVAFEGPVLLMQVFSIPLIPNVEIF